MDNRCQRLGLHAVSRPQVSPSSPVPVEGAASDTVADTLLARPAPALPTICRGCDICAASLRGFITRGLQSSTGSDSARLRCDDKWAVDPAAARGMDAMLLTVPPTDRDPPSKVLAAGCPTLRAGLLQVRIPRDSVLGDWRRAVSLPSSLPTPLPACSTFWGCSCSLELDGTDAGAGTNAAAARPVTARCTGGIAVLMAELLRGRVCVSATPVAGVSGPLLLLG